MSLSVNAKEILDHLVWHLAHFEADATRQMTAILEGKARTFYIFPNTTETLYKIRFLEANLTGRPSAALILQEFIEGRALITHKREDGKYDVIATQDLADRLLSGKTELRGKKGQKQEIASVSVVETAEISNLFAQVIFKESNFRRESDRATVPAQTKTSWSPSKILGVLKSFFSAFTRSQTAEIAAEEEMSLIKSRAQETMKREQEKNDATVREQVKKEQISRDERRREISKEEVTRSEARRYNLRSHAK